VTDEVKALTATTDSSALPIWAAVQLALGAGLSVWPLIQTTPIATVFTLVGGFLMLHASLMFLTSLSESALARATLRFVGSHVVKSGVGFYGLVTLSWFIQLEVVDLIATLSEGWPETLRAMVKDWLIGFSKDSLMNFIEAVQWPWKLLLPAGLPIAAAALLTCYLPYRLGMWLLPSMDAELSGKTKDQSKSSA